MFLAFTIVYLIDGSVRALGLGASNFLKNPWNVFDFVTVVGTAATTVPVLLGTTSQAAVQLQKLFLVAIAFKVRPLKTSSGADARPSSYRRMTRSISSSRRRHRR